MSAGLALAGGRQLTTTSEAPLLQGPVTRRRLRDLKQLLVLFVYDFSVVMIVVH